ncbi:hypothetical protein APUTEX25_003446 [Auxenochlorella protothecoides]|uniref:Uncharacterized protein n=1 Tax=Auxenochlorella protothecoides TaxID=3075 RepID=A0A3M7KXS7_AUXPR|nr:hypothetical protein APUTEX25_003446 [Auxenochlorella protothecoides]|eukprot:RMZ55308.1 hypothetical protein APUTEX25_003446 [Auxenochlorella protothecoides]
MAGTRSTKTKDAKKQKLEGPEELPTPTVVEVVTAENNELSILLHHAQKTDSVAIGVRLQSQARLDVLIPFLSDKLGEDETKSVKKLQEDLESDLKKDFQASVKKLETGPLAQLVEQGVDLTEITPKYLKAKESASIEARA